MVLSPFVSEVVVVAGHKAVLVEDALASLDTGGSIRVVKNPEFASTNSMYSVFVASDTWVDADRVVFTNSDIVLSPPSIHDFMSATDPHTVLVAEKECDHEDMKVSLRAGSLEVEEISKDIPLDVAYGEFTGVYSAVGTGVGEFHMALDHMIANLDMRRRGWYDLVLNSMAHEGVVRVTAIGERDYAEVDTLSDWEWAGSVVESWGTQR
jgi:choline kinase